jgi:N-acyl-D-aspartate/D-glutamate deacylase/CubicO group peptidase (beta-lactamase class C family)
MSFRNLAFIVCAGVLGAQAVAWSSSDQVDAIVQAEMTKQRIPGVAVAVVRNGETVKSQGYGEANVELKVPVTPDTIFQSGSLGKQFTSAAIMALVDDGKLAVTERITKFFPDAPDTWRNITVLQLLTHTSGIANYTAGKVNYRRDYTEDELVKLAYGLPLDFTPGDQWRYSNTGYVLLGVIVRKVSGRFYGDVLRDRVFQPLGMQTARVISEADIVPNRSGGYSLEDKRLQNQAWVSPSLNTTADGALYLSLNDLTAWARGLRAKSVLSAASWNATFSPVQLNSGRRHPYALGWAVDRVKGYNRYQHGGSWQGFKTHLVRYVADDGSDLSVIVLANLAQAQPDVIAAAVAGHYIPKLLEPSAFTIRGAQVADGSGGPLQRVDVRFDGDTIREIGTVTPQTEDRVIDGTGLVLAPGFIDAHNHSTEGLDTDPGARTQVSQGITTVLLGQDGSSPLPIGEYLDRRRTSPAAVNAALLVGHASVRRRVMGDDFRRQATRHEIARMEALVDEGMRQGAVGLSSGLEYEVGSYAATDEVVALARVAGKHGGFYISHIRDEADQTLDAVREAITIGERAKLPVQITHIKLGTVGVWGKAQEVVAMIDAARKRGQDVTADAYPYLAWHSNLKVLVPNKQWTDPASVKEALDDVGGGKNIQIVRLPKYPQYVGKRLDEIAHSENMSEVDLYIRIVQDDDAGVIGHTISAPDLRTFYQQPWIMVASDGGVGMNHPRAAGTFTRVLGRYVRDDQWLTLPEAIRKMTSLPAWRLGLKDRGTIRVGMKADLVLLDPTTVLDLSTFEQPRLLSQGIHTVFVNGTPVWGTDRPAGPQPGRVLSR